MRVRESPVLPVVVRCYRLYKTFGIVVKGMSKKFPLLGFFRVNVYLRNVND